MRFYFTRLARNCGTPLLAILTVAASAANDPYTGPVYAPPSDCVFDAAASSYLSLLATTGSADNPPVQRTVIQRAITGSSAATQANASPTLLNHRTVTYRYGFTLLDQTLPPDFRGRFGVKVTEVIVYKGPAGQATASDRLESDPLLSIQPTWASSTTEAMVGNRFFSTWDVRVLVGGYQFATATSAGVKATIALLCKMPIN
jgi:hypothetical protein